MNGVTTAILLFIFLGMAIPALIKNKPQFYGALAGILVVIFLDALAHVVHSDGFSAFAYFMCAVVQIFAVLLLVLSSGGLSVEEFKKEVVDTIEVVRRGESEKEVIIPLRGKTAADEARSGEGAPRRVYKVDDPQDPPAGPPAAKPGGQSKPDTRGPLPLA
ncbi:MAG: hypothetical protein ABSF29_13445 [Tepidisphaeraceae bacterium]|jgi:hypothetical protein